MRKDYDYNKASEPIVIASEKGYRLVHQHRAQRSFPNVQDLSLESSRTDAMGVETWMLCDSWVLENKSKSFASDENEKLIPRALRMLCEKVEALTEANDVTERVAQSIVDEATTPSQWRLPGDLPKSDGVLMTVLATRDDGEVVIICYRDDDGWMDGDTIMSCKPPIAWMPVPEPYVEPDPSLSNVDDIPF